MNGIDRMGVPPESPADVDGRMPREAPLVGQRDHRVVSSRRSISLMVNRVLTTECFSAPARYLM